MGDWNEIVMGRSSMGRVRPLILALNALRRREEEGRERGPGVIPGGEGGLMLGIEMMGRGFLAGKIVVFLWVEVDSFQHQFIQRFGSNPIPSPAVWLWDPDPKVNL